MPMWGKHRENGIWLGSRSRWRLLWRDHDSLFVAAWRIRLRIMKWWRPFTVEPKPCAPVPCPSFQTMRLEATAICSCHDLQIGDLFTPGCPIHDPAAVA